MPGLLQDGYRYHTVRVRLLERQLTEVIAYLQGRGLDPLLAKGWSLGRLYPEPGLRPYGDLDLLLLPEQVREGREALTEPMAPVAPVEIHSGFPMLSDRTPEALFERSRTVPFQGGTIRILGPEDELRLVCLHGLNHGLCRPLWLCDVAVLLERLPPRFDWNRAMEGEGWLSEGVRCALGLAEKLLGISLEAAGVPSPWRDPPLPTWLVPAALMAFSAKEHYLQAGDPGELLFQPRRLAMAARLRWVNPIEATYRRAAPWNDAPRFPIQLVDYLSRGLGFLRGIPGNLRVAREISRRGDPPEIDLD